MSDYRSAIGSGLSGVIKKLEGMQSADMTPADYQCLSRACVDMFHQGISVGAAMPPGDAAAISGNFHFKDPVACDECGAAENIYVEMLVLGLRSGKLTGKNPSDVVGAVEYVSERLGCGEYGRDEYVRHVMEEQIAGTARAGSKPD